jgi:hypothetical protein
MTIWQIIEDLKWQLKGFDSYRKSRLSQFWGMPPGQDFMIIPTFYIIISEYYMWYMRR